MPHVTVTVTGQGPILASLSRRSGPELNKTIREATKAAGNAVKPFIAGEAPIRSGKLRKSVSVRSNRRSIGVNVGPRAWYRHFVIRGTQRGIRANPFVGRGSSRGEFAARSAFETTVKQDVKR